jgi:hypothetical protein
MLAKKTKPSEPASSMKLRRRFELRYHDLVGLVESAATLRTALREAAAEAHTFFRVLGLGRWQPGGACGKTRWNEAAFL